MSTSALIEILVLLVLHSWSWCLHSWHAMYVRAYVHKNTTLKTINTTIIKKGICMQNYKVWPNNIRRATLIQQRMSWMCEQSFIAN